MFFPPVSFRNIGEISHNVNIRLAVDVNGSQEPKIGFYLVEGFRFLRKTILYLVVFGGNILHRQNKSSILSGYLIQCNDESGNPFNDSESDSKWTQGGSSLKGTCMHRKSASEEALM